MNPCAVSSSWFWFVRGVDALHCTPWPWRSMRGLVGRDPETQKWNGSKKKKQPAQAQTEHRFAHARPYPQPQEGQTQGCSAVQLIQANFLLAAFFFLSFLALFSFKIFCKIDTVAFSFVFDKYFPIID